MFCYIFLLVFLKKVKFTSVTSRNEAKAVQAYFFALVFVLVLLHTFVMVASSLVIQHFFSSLFFVCDLMKTFP